MKHLVFCASLMILIGCGEEQDVNNLPFLQKDDGVKVESFGVEYLFSDSSRVTAQLLAPHIYEKENETGRNKVIHYVDQGLRLNFLDANGNAKTYVTADSGIFDLKIKEGTLKGSVFMKNYKGETLETESLFWDDRKDSVYTEEKVRIETADKIIIGKKGFRANTDFTSYIIYGIEGELEADTQ